MGFSVPARLVDDFDSAGGIPGAFRYFSDGAVGPTGLRFVCPCGCGRISSIWFDVGQPAWHWDGDRASPTLLPVISAGCWRGSLISGQWVAR